MAGPEEPGIFHIVHVDRLLSIVDDGFLFSDAVMATCAVGTSIGMQKIKDRRLNELTLTCHPTLHVGECVPFYFCPRSIMLYVIHRRNSELTYRDGQRPIIHLRADLRKVVARAESEELRWAFTLSNAGSRYFEDRADLTQLSDLDWNAINATSWRDCKDEKQAEFLVEERVPWELIELIGVKDKAVQEHVIRLLEPAAHKPDVEIRQNWYY